MRYLLVTLSMLIGALCIFGYVVFTETQRTVRRIQSTQWPTTLGTVVASELNYSVSRGRPSSTPRYAHLAEVTYTYTVNGVTFQATDQYHLPNDSDANEQRARDYLARFPVGTEVSVAYQPANPALATIDGDIAFALNRRNAFIGIPFSLFMVLIFGFVFSTSFPLD